MKLNRTIFLTSLLMMLIVAAPFTAGAASALENFFKLQAAIFYKVLSYDSAVATRGGAGIVIGVVLDGSTSSKAADIKTGFSSIAGSKVSGKPVSIKIIKDASAIAASGANILYLPEGASSGTLQAALSEGHAKKIPILAGSEDLVKKGAAVGVVLEGGKPRILVNIVEAGKQGMSLSSQLLKLAKIVK